MFDSIAYRTARNRVHAFAGESDELMVQHFEAMECRNCESFLQLGIDAFHWLSRADIEIHKAIFSGAVEHDAAIEAALETLYRTWLKPCEFTERWIVEQLKRGFELENLTEFRKCVEEVRAIVGGNHQMTSEMEQLRDLAVESHLKGETIEWDIA